MGTLHVLLGEGGWSVRHVSMSVLSVHATGKLLVNLEFPDLKLFLSHVAWAAVDTLTVLVYCSTGVLLLVSLPRMNRCLTWPDLNRRVRQ